MAKRLSDYLRNALVNHVRGGAAFAQPAALYASLHSSDPGGNGAGEISGGSYSRKAVTFGAASGGVASSTGTITFQDMPAVTVAFVGLWDAASGGNFLASGSQNPKSVPAGDDFVFDAGDLTFALE